jgi:predicted TIM-barrel fold metal-dependent hydrolase
LLALAFAARQDAAGQKPAPTGPVRSVSPFIDAHAHLDAGAAARSIEAALRAMPAENAIRIVFMPPPFTMGDPARYDAEKILPAVKAYPEKFAVLGGGGSLNGMIQYSMQSGDVSPDIRLRFKQRAEELLREGVAGFGEMTAEHFAGATPYQSAPPNHPLFLLLADIAAEHGVPIDLHMEAVPEDMPPPAPMKSPPQLRANIAAFERLLAHNPSAKIIWAHAGWDNTGFRTPALCRRLLAAYPNLYMDVKIDPAKPGKNSPLTNGGSGSIKPEWLKLFQDFPDRFVMGSDQHYPEPLPGPQRWEAVALLLNQLPDGLRQKMASENARWLYSASH